MWGSLDLTTRQCSPEAEETFRRLTSPKFTVFRVWAGRRRSGHRWKCCCPPRAPGGSGPGPGRPSPTSAHTHIPAPRSAHTLLPLPSRPLAHTYLCAQHQNMTPVESFTPRGPPAPPMPPGAQAALLSAPLCGARGEADGSGPSAGRFLPSCGAPSVSPSSRSLVRVAPLSPAPWSQPPPRLRTFCQPGLSLSSSDAAEGAKELG